MPKQTKAEKIIQELLKWGCKEVASKSRKYRQFKRPNFDNYYFVGRHGALRVGKTVSNSVSLTKG